MNEKVRFYILLGLLLASLALFWYANSLGSRVTVGQVPIGRATVSLV